MKKLICILTSIILLGSMSFAQQKDDRKAIEGKAKVTKTPASQAAPASAAKTGAPKQVKETKAAPAAADAKQGKMKKDGTPDKRFKENKEEAKPAGKLKKDGTPDMRYKENKKAAAKPASGETKK